MLEKIWNSPSFEKIRAIPLCQKLWEFYKENEEGILYLVFGAFATFINIAVFMLFNWFGMAVLPANTIAFVVSVLFAYWSNSRVIFRAKQTVQNLLQFFGMRILTLLFDNVAMVFLVNIYINKLLSKIIVNVVIIIFNFFMSKFFIFKKKDQ